MKSIKEKAKEVFPEHCNFYTDSCNKRKRIGFEVGANAVLEILYHTAYKEDWITNPKDGVKRFFEIYKELKGK